MGLTTRSSRQRGGTTTRLAAVFALLLGSVALYAGGAGAVHDENLFELGPPFAADILSDGNVANGPDWARNGADGIFNAAGQAQLPANGLAAAFIQDDSAQKGLSDRTTFNGTSNKNNDAVSSVDCANRVPPLTGSACAPWVWDSGNVPAKDDLYNVYSYAANDTRGTTDPSDDHLILYAGVERLDPNGDSHVDLEFYQDQISLDEAIPCNDPGPDPTPCHFLGSRTPEDIIVSMDYVTGGGIGSVSVHEWNGSEYIQVGLAGGEGCFDAQGGTGGDDICVANNGSSIDGGPWRNQDKSNNEVTNLSANAFTEFGIDVTALLGDTPCLSTFLPKTRSSQSFTAELKDFAGPASFNICGADIQIAGTATNEVGVDHTFTVTVNQKLGTATSPAPDGTIVDVDLTAANGAAVNLISDNCASPGTVSGTCTVTFDSTTAGTITGHATATLNIAGNQLTVQTDGQGTNSGDVVKTYVDARISITPSDTNSIEENHTFVVNVKKDAGDGAGFVNVAGVNPTVTLTNGGGAVNSISSNTCATTGTDASGNCSVTFTSSTAGTVTGHASVDLTVGGISLHRETTGSAGNSGDVVKTFVAGTLRWTKVDNAGVKQGGATFEVCRTHNFNSATGQMDAITAVCVSVTDNSAPDTDADNGEILLTGLRLGRYTIRETAAPPGFVPDPDTVTAPDLTLANPNSEVTEAFVNNRPIVKITGFGYTNTPTGTPTAGVLSGATVFTATLKNFGGADTNVSGSLTVTANNSQGTFSCAPVASPAPALAYGPSLLQKNQGNTVTVTTTCTYSGFNDGAVVTAVLTTNYTTNGLVRAASGSPATISFTVQGD